MRSPPRANAFVSVGAVVANISSSRPSSCDVGRPASPTPFAPFNPSCRRHRENSSIDTGRSVILPIERAAGCAINCRAFLGLHCLYTYINHARRDTTRAGPKNQRRPTDPLEAARALRVQSGVRRGRVDAEKIKSSWILATGSQS